MELINATALAARLSLSPDPSVDDAHLCAVSAKATFRYSASGAVELDANDPLPLWDRDLAGPLGVLPNDLALLPYADDSRCEVFLLGAAYARNATSITASIHIGEWSTHVDVWGARAGLEGVAGAPATFDRVPLTWEHAAGGTVEVWIDPWTIVDVTHPTNPLGKGFDPREAATSLTSALGAPEGFPRWDPSPRPLPQVVRHGESPTGAAEPFCWAPPPPEVTATVERNLARWREAHPDEERIDLEWVTAFRADPAMVFPVAPLGEQVTLSNCDPNGTASFRLPPLLVLGDYVADGRRGTIALEPRRIVLLPEEQRFYITYHAFARLRDRVSGGERSLRLRLE